MKIRNKAKTIKTTTTKKPKLIVLIILGLVLLACAVGLIISLIGSENQEEPLMIYGIQIANNPNKMEYQVGEKFDPTGTKIQVVMNKQEETFFVDYDQLEFSGFDSSVANNAVVVTVKYKEHSTTFTVKVKEKQTVVNPNPGSANFEVCDMVLTYSLSRWNSRGPSTYGAYAKITKPDGTTYGSITETPLSNDMIYGYDKVDAPGQYELTIVFVEKDGTEHSATVVVTITE